MNALLDKQLLQKYAIRIGRITQEHYENEVNVIDIAGVYRHFVEL
jgi:hypothetical protein